MSLSNRRNKPVAFNSASLPQNRTDALQNLQRAVDNGSLLPTEKEAADETEKLAADIQRRTMYIDWCAGNLVDGLLFAQIMYSFGKSKRTNREYPGVQMRTKHVYNESVVWCTTYRQIYDTTRITEQPARRSLERLKETHRLIFCEVGFSYFTRNTALMIGLNESRIFELIGDDNILKRVREETEWRKEQYELILSAYYQR
jgi:hypothetical protein